MASNLALRMRGIAAGRGWGWPALSGGLTVIGVIVLAVVHQQIDLSTYLLGGQHAWTNNLFSVTLPKDGLGFTYPPFSALLFAPGAHAPLAVAEIAFSLLNLVAVFAPSPCACAPCATNSTSARSSGGRSSF